jgi:hypothetical protein
MGSYLMIWMYDLILWFQDRFLHEIDVQQDKQKLRLDKVDVVIGVHVYDVVVCDAIHFLKIQHVHVIVVVYLVLAKVYY